MGKKHKKAKLPKEVLGVKLPKEVREVGGALLEKANSPQGREMLAAGLTMAAAAATAALAKGRAERAAKPDAPRPPEVPVPPVPPGSAGSSCPAGAARLARPAAGHADAARSAGDRRCGRQGGGGDAGAIVRSERLTQRGLRGARCPSDIGTDCMAPGHPGCTRDDVRLAPRAISIGPRVWVRHRSARRRYEGGISSFRQLRQLGVGDRAFRAT